MKVFRDPSERLWEIKINVASIRRVREMLGIDLATFLDDRMQQLGELLNKPERFVDVLFVLLQGQAEKYGISDVQFGEMMAGEILETASEQFVQELLDFFPSAKMRVVGREVIAKAKQLSEEMAQQAKQRIGQINVTEEAKKLIGPSLN